MYSILFRSSIFKALALCLLLLFGVRGEGYGQRVYADITQSSATPLLASVMNPLRAVNQDTSDYSTLSVTLGLVGLISAHQNLQFVNVRKPQSNSPIVIKFGVYNQTLLNLLGGFVVQRTNSGATNLISPSYSGAQLLDLLGLLATPQTATIIVPPNGQTYDGIRLEVNTVLGIALTSYYYYAFYIIPPQLALSEITHCEGDITHIILDNFQSGYTYKVYDSEIGGNEIVAMRTTTNSIKIPVNLSAGSYKYWIEARESNLYPSARTEVTVTVRSKPSAPNIKINTNSQYY